MVAPRLVYIPYLIISGVCFLVSIVFYVQILANCSFAVLDNAVEIDTSTEHHVIGKSITLETHFKPFWFFVVISGFFMIFSCIGRDAAMLYFSATVGAESSLGMSPQIASLVSTMANAARGVGRLIFTVLAGCVPLQWLLCCSAAAPVLLSLMLLLFGLDSWGVYCGLLGTNAFVSSPTYPLFVAWVSRHAATDGYVCAVLTCGQAFGGFVGMWGSGLVFAHYGSHGWFVLEFALAACTLVSFMLLQGVTFRRGMLRGRDGGGDGGGKKGQEKGDDTPAPLPLHCCGTVAPNPASNRTL